MERVPEESPSPREHEKQAPPKQDKLDKQARQRNVIMDKLESRSRPRVRKTTVAADRW